MYSRYVRSSILCTEPLLLLLRCCYKDSRGKTIILCVAGAKLVFVFSVNSIFIGLFLCVNIYLFIYYHSTCKQVNYVLSRGSNFYKSISPEFVEMTGTRTSIIKNDVLYPLRFYRKLKVCVLYIHLINFKMYLKA